MSFPRGRYTGFSAVPRSAPTYPQSCDIGGSFALRISSGVSCVEA